LRRAPRKDAAPKGGPTPALRQYFEAKEVFPEAVLFFQMGDFYELFFEDAELVAPLLDLALTSRQKLDGKPVPLCGVPLSAGEGYIARLVALGHKVAVCDQVSSPAPGELAERSVRRVVTPGTIVSPDGPADARSRYLAACCGAPGRWGLVAADLSTGDVVAGQWDDLDGLQAALAALEPKEVMWSASADDDLKTAAAGSAFTTERPAEDFDPALGERLLSDLYPAFRIGPPAAARGPAGGAAGGLAGDDQDGGGQDGGQADDHTSGQDDNQGDSHGDDQTGDQAGDQADGSFKSCGGSLTASAEPASEAAGPPPDSAGPPQARPPLAGPTPARLPPPRQPLAGRPVLLAAAGALLTYLRELTRGADLGHLAEPRLLSDQGRLGLDEAAVRNLELFKSLRDGTGRATLLSIIDQTTTAMGARLLRDWLARPLTNASEIGARHGAVEVLASDAAARQTLTGLLAEVGDLERALGRLTLGRGSVRDLYAVRRCLAAAPKIKEALEASPAGRLSELGSRLDALPALRRRLDRLLCEPSADKDAPVVAAGASPVLDRLRRLEAGGKSEIAALEARERRRTGITGLKIGFNKVFGYYLEVTRSHLASVPPEWIRKQTVSGAERYVTEDLKGWEESILTAGEKRQALEARIVDALRLAAARRAPDLKALAAILAEADALASLAACAERRGWTRPALTTDDLIDIRGGRHPVVEDFLPPGEPFVDNDVLINHRERLLIITGPNMAGKSTILRQTALIVILNQMGSFVPAASATLSIRDQVFTRVGAADDLARGQSTFMVEMSETARILRKATSRSLVILDEVGRGTSTFDGLAIAWAVAEHLHDLGGRGAPTLFATHYHELVELARHKPMVRNYNVSVKRWGDTMLFLRKLAPGGVNRSYGLDVASLAGLPPQVVKRAREVLADVGRETPGLIRRPERRGGLLVQAGLGQDGPAALAREIAALEPDRLTPVEALNVLAELRQRAKEVLS
jgi:DNA mismatch repair protein MutS